MTETLPFGGCRCEQGHLHFEPTLGLLELINPFTGSPARPDEWATIVATPLPPLRETTILLRYDTEDLVRALPEELDCMFSHMPACSAVAGKLDQRGLRWAVASSRPAMSPRCWSRPGSCPCRPATNCSRVGMVSSWKRSSETPPRARRVKS